MNDPPEVGLHRKLPREASRIAPSIEAYGAQLWRQSAIE